MKAKGFLIAGVIGGLALAAVVTEVSRNDGAAQTAPPHAVTGEGVAGGVSGESAGTPVPREGTGDEAATGTMADADRTRENMAGRSLSDRSIYFEGGGTIANISRDFKFEGVDDGVRIVMRRGADELNVFAGPEWFLESQDFDLQLSDEIQVRGSMVTVGGEPVIFPTMIIKDDKVIQLRDEQGTPLWLG